jgi:hypothetical protein
MTGRSACHSFALDVAFWSEVFGSAAGFWVPGLFDPGLSLASGRGKLIAKVFVGFMSRFDFECFPRALLFDALRFQFN